MLFIDERAQKKMVPFASNESERCVASVYSEEYEVRGLRCGLLKDHSSSYHLSKPEESGGMSRLWTSLDFGFTLDCTDRSSGAHALVRRDFRVRRWISKFFRLWRHS